MNIEDLLYKVMCHTASFYPDKFYIKKQFKHCLGYKLDLENPKTFQEKLQWLKLYDRKPVYSQMVDKYEAKNFIKEKVGDEYIIPTIGIFNRAEEIHYEKLPQSFVMKTTHDSGTVVVCRDKAQLNIDQTNNYLNKRLKRNYYYREREWPYRDVKPRIIVEKLIGNEGEDLSDYKFFCFDGEPKALYITTNRGKEGGLKEDFFYADGKRMEVNQKGYFNNSQTPSLPINFEKMKDIAKVLAKGIPHLRVDFYETDGNVYVGELTFSDGGGFSPFVPDEYNRLFGDWIKLPKDK